MKEYWMCIIGPVDHEDLRSGADGPLRIAVRRAFNSMTGQREDVCFSGWGIGEKRMEEIREIWNKEQEK